MRTPSIPPHQSAGTPWSRPAAALVAVLLVLGVLLVAPPTAGAAAATPAPGDHVDIASLPVQPLSGGGSGAEVEISGRGWGHGIGMGQWGAYGYARDHGWTYRQILDHYYGETQVGSAPNQLVTVRLEAHNDGFTYVYLANGAMTIATKEGQPIEQYDKAMRFRRFAPNRFYVEHAPSCAGPWTRVPGLEIASSEIHVSPPAVPNPTLDQTLAVCTGGSNRTWYRGQIRAVADPDGIQRTVNALDLETYLRGVVPRESPASWGNVAGGMHALRAQAVAARTYTVAENRWSYARTCDTAACHVYGGRARDVGNGPEALEHANTDKAVADTAGEVRVRSGELIYAQYSASTGGHTKSSGSVGSRGWFPAVPDLGDTVSPRHTWTTRVPVGSLESKYGRTGLQSITVLARNGLGADGGRVERLQLQFTSGTVEVSGNQFRRDASLFSDWFSFGPTSGGGGGGGTTPTYTCPAEGLGSIQRLYHAYFLRAPDAKGLAFWAGEIHTKGLEWIARHFAESSEFQRRYGSLDTAGFLELVYANVMDRAPDPGGRAYWTNRVANGLSRGGLMLYFSDSSEYRRITGNCP